DFMRVLLTMGEDAKAALEIADKALKSDPNNRSIRYLRALCLLQSEREEEGLQVLEQLGNEQPPMAEALYRLASHYEGVKEESKKAIELFERYTALVPEDPRAHESLASLYDAQKDARAESSYRAAISCDRRNPSRYIDLAAWLAAARRYPDAMAAIDEGVKHGASGDEMFASLISRFMFADESDTAEEIARTQPERMAKNARANLYLAYARMLKERMRDALPLLKKAAELDPADADPHTSMAEAYLSLGQYRSALASADAAIRIDKEDSMAHYHRACALARLGRATQAIAALARAIEIDEELREGIEEEKHLKSLARLPAFKKLIQGEEKENQK
ncbi:MAG TPA: tetratricopeptide repeat protein, partial [Blastocatellia bacterium]|nr:tetratricopeptide repeat protein [Blastocatellia bacterium]